MDKKTVNSELNELKPGINSNTSSSIKSYFNFYSQLVNQQGMLMDCKRTKTYYNSIINNKADFENKIVMDVGTGSGILALFCALNGAKKVYAIEGSEIAKYAEILIKSNNLSEKIILINKKLEDIKEDEIPEKIDIIISEPLGVLLLNERMIETVLIARDRFLNKNGGNIYPNNATLHFVPFSDAQLYNYRISQLNFWQSTNFYGVDFNSLYEHALEEKFRKPIIEAYNPVVHCSNITCQKNFNFMTIKPEDLLEVKIPLKFKFDKPYVIHGISGWFDAFFVGSQKTVTLSTSPFTYTTHWYQVRFLFKDPIAVNKGQSIDGYIEFKGNNEQTYFINIFIQIEGTDFSTKGFYCLRDTEFFGLSRVGGVNNWAIDDKIEEKNSIVDTKKV